jgi:hypothetical protein
MNGLVTVGRKWKVSLCLLLAFWALTALVFSGCSKEKAGEQEKPKAAQKVSQLQDFALPQETNDLDLSVDRVEDEGGIITVVGWAAIKNRDSIDDVKYLVLKSQNKTYIFDSFSLWKRPDVTKQYKINRDDSGFNVFIPKEKIEKGEYNIGLIVKKGNMTSFQYSQGSPLKF